MIPNVLSIAGSDPSGGAGIQADLKTFAALGTYGCAVITGLTAQNTIEVTAVHEVPPDFVVAQLEVLWSDVHVAATKTGMLGSAALIRAVARALRTKSTAPLVVDPVMIAKGGHRLLPADAVNALVEDLVPLATLLTPNLPEAAALLGRTEVVDLEGMKETATALLGLGPSAVLLKGGHLAGAESPDVYCDRDRTELLMAPRIETKNTHGTGCTLSAAIAAELAKGRSLFEAVRVAKSYLSEAIARGEALQVGEGHGPVHHGWPREISRVDGAS